MKAKQKKQIKHKLEQALKRNVQKRKQQLKQRALKTDAEKKLS